MVDSLILYYFIIYVGLIAVWMVGYFIIRYILTKNNPYKKRRISTTKIYRTLLIHKHQCEELYNRFNDLLKMRKCQWKEECNIIKRELYEIHKELEKSNLEQFFQIRKLSIFESVHIVLIGQFIKIFMLTTIILLLSGCSCIISLISISIVSQLHIQELSSVVYEFCNIRMEEFGTSPYGMCLWFIYAVIFLVLTVILIRKVVKLISTQYDIIFMACQLSGTVLLADRLNEYSIAEEFYQMEKNIQIKSSYNQIGKILHRIFD